MNTQLKELFMQARLLMLLIWLTAGLVLMGDWFNASLCQARGERGPNGGAAARGPNGGGAARGPNGGAAARGPNGGAVARGPNGQVVAAPRGRVAPPVYPAAGVRPVPVPVPVPVPCVPVADSCSAFCSAELWLFELRTGASHVRWRGFDSGFCLS